jgi:hypothetical protein
LPVTPTLTSCAVSGPSVPVQPVRVMVTVTSGATGGLLQAPVAGLHVPALWHASDGVHGVAATGVQTPLIHTSGVHRCRVPASLSQGV